MRKHVTFGLLILLLCCQPAMAGSAYDEVPLDHWSYKVLEYWQDRLLVHPEQAEAIHFSEAGQPQTRYEFALPTAIAMGGLDRNYPLGDFVLVEVMRLEYSDQLAILGGRVRLDENGNDLSYPQELVVSDLRWKPNVHIDCDSANNPIVALIIDYFNFVGRLDIPNQFRDSFLPMTAQDISQLIADSDIESQPVVDSILMAIVEAEIEGTPGSFIRVDIHDINHDSQTWTPTAVKLEKEPQWQSAFNNAKRKSNTGVVYEYYPDPEQFELATAPEVQQRHSAYDEVPRDHWAYRLMDWLVNESDQEFPLDYPSDFFSTEDRVLTRFEFGQANYRLAESFGSARSPQQSLILLILFNEFNEQMQALSHGISAFERYGVPDLGFDTALHDSAEFSVYSEVEFSHWAYDAVRYFIDSGYLEGYPKHFFCRDRIFTRYEFAQAIARLLDTISDLDDPDPYDIQITECLRGEFSDVLNSLSSRVDALGLHILDMKVTMDDLAGTVSN
ncbi:hypothetical protein KDL44_14960 [bacterium]|nr:hypothetical protein [bacterium]